MCGGDAGTGLPPDGKAYRPSNGTEGMRFFSEWCDACARRGPDDETGCRILSDSFLGQVAEWTWQGGRPVCRVFAVLACPVEQGPDGLPDPDPRQLQLGLDA